MSEQVLVCERELMDKLGRGIITDEATIEDWVEELEVAGSILIDREEAEDSEDFVQLIPYVVVWRGKEIFIYQRGEEGGEDRLHGKWSLGIGGHINEKDSDEHLWGNVAGNIHRELKEELGLVFENDFDVAVPKALIYMDGTSVEKVHCGLVYFFQAGMHPDLKVESTIIHGEWVKGTELKKRPLEWENWSQLIVEKLL